MNDTSKLVTAAKVLQAKYPTKEFCVIKNIEGVDVVSFTHDGTSIYDPYASDCGRFKVDPKDIYEIEHDDAILMAKANGISDSHNSLINEYIGTESFEKWFANSRVVDSNGQPLVIYHGGHFKADEFEGFDPELTDPDNNLGAGFYFTTSKKDAEGYDYNREYDEPQVLSVFVSLQNPYILGESQKIEGFESEEGGEDFRLAIEGEGYDGIIDKSVDTKFSHEGYQPGAGVWHIVAFYPEQIKSATSQDGNFFKPDGKKNKPRLR